MNQFFSARFFSNNRRHLQRICASEMPIVVTANGLLQRTADNTYPFQQDSNFWYLTGISLPDITLVISGGQDYLIVPDRTESRQAFDGMIDHSELSHISGITAVYDETSGWVKLNADISKHKQVATPLASDVYIEQHGMYVNPARARMAARLHEQIQGLELVDIRSKIAGLRIVKQPEEIAAIQKAIDITIDSLELLTAPKRFAGYTNEYEIEADLSREFRYRGASGHAFAPIIAGGKRACTLHNVANEGQLEQGSLVVLDVGAEVSHYAADITRTRAYGTVSDRQQAVFEAVIDVQKYAIGLLKPGVLLKTYEKEVEAYMGATLQRLGLIDEPSSEHIRHYFPHATSHFMGLDVHDAGDYDRALEPGMVLTCEPGIYIPEESIGIRIEDDLLITDAGNSVLSARIPKTLM